MSVTSAVADATNTNAIRAAAAQLATSCQQSPATLRSAAGKKGEGLSSNQALLLLVQSTPPAALPMWIDSVEVTPSCLRRHASCQAAFWQPVVMVTRYSTNGCFCPTATGLGPETAHTLTLSRSHDTHPCSHPTNPKESQRDHPKES